MILLVEMQCKDWEHNRVNAGIIKMFHKAFPEENIKLYAEKRHITGVSELIADTDIVLDSSPIEFYDWRFESEKNAEYYEQLMQQIVGLEKDAKRIIFLSCNKGIVMAADSLSRQMPDIEVCLILHAALEEVCKNFSIHEKLKNLYHKLRGKEQSITMRECMNKCELPNCKFIIYSPCYEKELDGKLENKIIEKFIFLHHPFYESDSKKTERIDDKIVIGLYGQAVNQNAYAIVSTYNQKYDNGRIIFRVMAKDGNPILEQDNVVRILDKDTVENADLEAAIQDFDYVMVPYANNQYRVTASGIFWDAISQEIPLLMLNSPFFEYYSKYQIGVVKNDIDSMAACLGELPDKQKAIFSDNERKLKEKSLEENICILREKMR